MHQRINNICSKAIILKVGPTHGDHPKLHLKSISQGESAKNFAWFAMEGVSHEGCWLHELLNPLTRDQQLMYVTKTM